MALNAEQLLAAYHQGLFPMADESGRIGWYDPDPRAILPLDGLHVSRSLRRRLRRGGFTMTWNSAFGEVVRACAAPAPGREETWISDELIAVYDRLHDLGFGHSVEVWMDERLAGGVFGVGFARFFAAESMFHHATDASKIALVGLVQTLRSAGVELLDVQFQTPHLASLGVIEIPRGEYLRRLRRAVTGGTEAES